MAAPLPPGSTIGILGGGQLGRMLALAAGRLGLKCAIYSDAAGPAFDVAAHATVGAYEDEASIKTFAASVDVVTYEFENIPVPTAEIAAKETPLYPGIKALLVAQDRLEEKTFIRGLGIPVAPFADITSDTDLTRALADFGGNGILKTRRLGYDGKGQVRLTTESNLTAALEEIGNKPAILEGLVPFKCEVSALVVRGTDGTTDFYDIPQNTHKGGILDTSTVPANIPPAVQARAQEIATKIANALGYVGLLAVEMFYLGEDASEPLVVNEIAPRVHNSGHWTMDACTVSQFENHIRAVAGWPLGPTNRHSDARMTNLIGADHDAWPDHAKSGAAVHLYGKNEARAGRKMGHINEIWPVGTPPPSRTA